MSEIHHYDHPFLIRPRASLSSVAVWPSKRAHGRAAGTEKRPRCTYLEHGHAFHIARSRGCSPVVGAVRIVATLCVLHVRAIRWAELGHWRTSTTACEYSSALGPDYCQINYRLHTSCAHHFLHQVASLRSGYPVPLGLCPDKRCSRIWCARFVSLALCSRFAFEIINAGHIGSFVCSRLSNEDRLPVGPVLSSPSPLGHFSSHPPASKH